MVSLSIMYQLIRKILFFLPAETAHTLSMSLLRIACSLPPVKGLLKKVFAPREKPLLLWGIRFLHPVGLAAGFDKNAKYLRELETLGFSHVEIGTVTPLAQAGNPKPRLFRLPKDLALINRMGFNNDGAEAIANRLKHWRKKNPTTQLIVGGNIGKNKQTPNESAWKDYQICFETLYPYVDYFTVNVSSPNTPGLRSLQEPEQLKKVLQALLEANEKKSNPKPILLKVAPDLEPEAMDEVIELSMQIGLNGLVLSNTTLSRESLNTAAGKIDSIGAGGLSGAPLKNRCVQWIRHANTITQGKIPLIASGGIFKREDAQEMLEAGASLMQVWTGFVYEGPSIVKKILCAKK
ncbi:MAG: hypothetical protein RL750_344 [Bacteroidota bacterium]